MVDRATDHERDRDVYDWWSRHPRLLDVFYTVVFFGREARIRRRTVEALDLSPGDRVLDLGCGNGNAFEPLRERVGSDGTVVGIDVSEGMTRRAAERIRERGWSNVHAVRGDATRLPLLDRAFDAVHAAMSLSAMPDPVSAVEAAHDALRPGGRLAVLDARPFQHWPMRALNLVLVPLFRAITNWVPDAGLSEAIASRFADPTVTDYTDGTLFVAAARREP